MCSTHSHPVCYQDLLKEKSRKVCFGKSGHIFVQRSAGAFVFLTLRNCRTAQMGISCAIKSATWHCEVLWSDKTNKKKVHERTDTRFARKLLLVLVIYLSNFSPIKPQFFRQLEQHSVDLLANLLNSLYSVTQQTDSKDFDSKYMYYRQILFRIKIKCIRIFHL